MSCSTMKFKAQLFVCIAGLLEGMFAGAANAAELREPVVFATRDFPAGSYIRYVHEIDRVSDDEPLLRGKISVNQSEIAGQTSGYVQSVCSPREIFGFKIKVPVRKNCAIRYSDVDFSAHTIDSTNVSANLEFLNQLKQARKKWSTLSDEYWELYGPRSMNGRSGRGRIVVAVKRIEGNKRFDKSDMEVITVPLHSIPAGALATISEAMGATAKYVIEKNSVVSIQMISRGEKSLPDKDYGWDKGIDLP